MPKSRNAALADARRRREADRLQNEFGGDRIAASIAHHRDRLRRAVDAHDYSSMRDARKVLADLGYRGEP